MSNYRFIMRTEDKVTRDSDGRLEMNCADDWVKTEYDSGEEDYAERYTDYHKGTKNEQSRMEEASDYNG